MGIRDRDYMKRPSDDDDGRSSSPESRAEEFAQRVLARSRKLILIGGIVLGIHRSAIQYAQVGGALKWVFKALVRFIDTH